MRQIEAGNIPNAVQRPLRRCRPRRILERHFAGLRRNDGLAADAPGVHGLEAGLEDGRVRLEVVDQRRLGGHGEQEGQVGAPVDISQPKHVINCIHLTTGLIVYRIRQKVLA